MTRHAPQETTNRWRTAPWLAALPLGLVAALALTAPDGHTQTPADPFDAPLRLLAEAKQAYDAVQDYQCLFVKREQMNGKMGPENVMLMKARTKPFSVYLRWQMPKALEAQQVCYVVGKNDGQMRVQSPGILGAVGFVSLALNDPRALQNSRHTIAEAGIGNLIDRYSERWQAEKAMNRTVVKVAEFDFAKRRCVRVEMAHPNSKPGEFYAYRGVLYFDKENKLPLRSEAYDWPRAGGPPDGDLLECFSYVNLQLNVKLGDDAFNY